MSTMSRFKIWVLVFSACMLSLSGCGGGGGGGQGQVNPNTSSSLSLDSVSPDQVSFSQPFNLSDQVESPSAAKLQAANTSTPNAATTTSNSPYTPAQIRTAYNLPAYPTNAWDKLSPTEAAQMGAGQTIYVVDAYHDPKIVEELKAFSQQFGLPVCTTTDIPVNASLPLVSADKNGCQLSVVYAGFGGMTNTAPAYDANWAAEIALDVQWAHATAPLARIVLVEAVDNTNFSLINAINLANAMGPGVVSMSFGASEGSWTASFDTAFSAADMTYVAATGDSGAAVYWPAVSAQVLAVGGTTLLSFQGNVRNESVWSGTGGGISKYVNLPDYQYSSGLGLVSQSNRNVADVAFNADPATGQYVATIAPGSTSVNWHRFGGTSIAAPQWAGVVATANAVRAFNGQGPIGLVQNVIYKAAANVSNFFGSVVTDITIGGNGFNAASKYDVPTGLGTPNVLEFIKLVVTPATQSGTVTPPAVAPVVSDITVNGWAGSSLSFTLSFTSSNAVTWTIANQPSGMDIDPSSGLITWTKPVAGNYAVTVTATDSVTHAAGSAVATLAIKLQPASNVYVQSATIKARQGIPLSFQMTAFSSTKGNLLFSLDSLDKSPPAGVSIDSNSGLLSWNLPVAGEYSFGVTVTDSVSKSVGRGKVRLIVSKPLQLTGPVITSAAITGQVGRPLNAFIGISDPDAKRIYVDISGAPAGMSYAASGPGIMLRWRRPVAGSYNLVVTVKDSNGLSSQVTVPLTVN